MATKDSDDDALKKANARRKQAEKKAAKGGAAADKDSRQALGGLGRLIGLGESKKGKKPPKSK